MCVRVCECVCVVGSLVEPGSKALPRARPLQSLFPSEFPQRSSSALSYNVCKKCKTNQPTKQTNKKAKQIPPSVRWSVRWNQQARVQRKKKCRAQTILDLVAGLEQAMQRQSYHDQACARHGNVLTIHRLTFDDNRRQALVAGQKSNARPCHKQAKCNPCCLLICCLLACLQRCACCCV